MKVRANSVYTFRRNGFDQIMRHAEVKEGQTVRVINLPSAPKCNVMGQCHIEDAATKTFLGMVDTRSLTKDVFGHGRYSRTHQGITAMENFLAGYIECLLWLATDDDGNTLDNLTRDDLSPDAITKITADCTDFYNAHSLFWVVGGWSDAQAGHDFYLTRCGHGAGFWDRDYNDCTHAMGKTLTDASKPYGDQTLYIGDDGGYYVA